MLHLIGDVQGCCDALDRLLAEIGFSPSRDRIVVLGDLVNRGPQSLQTLRRLRELGDSAVCLLGNHDLHLLALAHGVRPLHRGDTVAEILDDGEREAWLEWIRTRRLAWREGGWLCVHAGLVPQWDGARALALAAEVEGLIAGPDLPAFLDVMYGNEPRRWDDALQGPERWRFIVNTLTRIRFCTAEGELEFDSKDSAAAAPEGYAPWFDIPGRASAGEPVACGHWSTLGLLVRDDLLALDTGCVWGGALTAVRVDGGRREGVQVPCARPLWVGAEPAAAQTPA
jgi:bis(5'-nucleosyl)-tetraphosphatase (symmetrical)